MNLYGSLIFAIFARQRVSYYSYIRSLAWRLKADAAKRAAGNRCQVCNSGARLEAHHRSYARLGHEKPSDITVLCHECHQIYEKNKRKQ